MCSSDLEPLVFGIDETIERRWGRKITARGIYRDPVRSSQSHFVKASGLRWVVLMLLVPLPWCQRVWALPVLTVLAPSERYHQERGQRHRKVTDWAQRLIAQLRRWLPQRKLVVVADAAYAKLALLARCQFLHIAPATRPPQNPATRARATATLDRGGLLCPLRRIKSR